MTEDRLAEIKARWAYKPEALEVSKAWALTDVRWLVGEVERLRQGDEFSRMHAEMVGLHRGFEVKEAEIERLQAEIERLRDRVFELKIYEGFGADHGHQRCIAEITRLRILAGEASPREILGLPDD